MADTENESDIRLSMYPYTTHYTPQKQPCQVLFSLVLDSNSLIAFHAQV